MQPLYVYHKVVEREPSSVSVFWKAFHIISFLLASIFGLTCSVFLHILLQNFDGRCVLYPKVIVFLNISGANTLYQKQDIPVDFIKSQWSDMGTCYLSLFNPILSMIFGIMWSVFFLMCSKGGRAQSGLKKPWRIVIPAFVFSLVYSIFCLVVSSNTNTGLASFTAKFQNGSDIMGIPVDHHFETIYSYVTVCLTTSWLCTFTWVAACLLLVLRCFLLADFQLVRVQVNLVEVRRDQFQSPQKHQNKILPAHDPSHSDNSFNTSNLSKDSLAPLIRKDEAGSPQSTSRDAEVRNEDELATSPLKSSKVVVFDENPNKVLVSSVTVHAEDDFIEAEKQPQ